MLPKNESTFHVSVIGEVTGERWEGDFTVMPIPPAFVRNAIHRDELREMGDLQNVSAEHFYRSKWLANLRHRILKAPTWWDGVGRGDLVLDDNLLKGIYDKMLEAETEWREKVKNKGAETSPPKAEA